MVKYDKDLDLRQHIISCIGIGFHEKESLVFLKGKGYDISGITYNRIKKSIKDSRFKRMNDISNTGFIDAHLQTLDNLLLIRKEMWLNYQQEKNPYKKVEILTQIANLEPYIRECYNSTPQVMENKTIKTRASELE
jgi:hypothetical protein